MLHDGMNELPERVKAWKFVLPYLWCIARILLTFATQLNTLYNLVYVFYYNTRKFWEVVNNIYSYWYNTSYSIIIYTYRQIMPYHYPFTFAGFGLVNLNVAYSNNSFTDICGFHLGLLFTWRWSSFVRLPTGSSCDYSKTANSVQERTNQFSLFVWNWNIPKKLNPIQSNLIQSN